MVKELRKDEAATRLEKEKDKLEKEKAKLRLREKLIKIKEEKKRAKGFNEIGRLACQVDIDQLDRDLLLGAFIDISQRCNDSKAKDAWRKNATSFLEENDNAQRTPLSVKFTAEPNSEMKNRLKEYGFRWNRFRREYAGYGSQNELKDLLDGSQATIEVLG